MDLAAVFCWGDRREEQKGKSYTVACVLWRKGNNTGTAAWRFCIFGAGDFSTRLGGETMSVWMSRDGVVPAFFLWGLGSLLLPVFGYAY